MGNKKKNRYVVFFFQPTTLFTNEIPDQATADACVILDAKNKPRTTMMTFKTGDGPVSTMRALTKYTGYVSATYGLARSREATFIHWPHPDGKFIIRRFSEREGVPTYSRSPAFKCVVIALGKNK